jgi:hypothetical protein
MTLRKIAILSALVGTTISGVAAAAAPVRASDSRSVVQSAGTQIGGSARTGKQDDASSSLVGGTLIIALIAGAAVIGGIVAATDNGGSN